MSDLFLERRKVQTQPIHRSNRTIRGYAARFDSPSSPLLGFLETLAPRCFDKPLQERQDCRGLLNHDANYVLSRVSNGTLRLTQDDLGLRFEMDVCPTTYGDDILELIDRRDITGMSFSFVSDKNSEKWGSTALSDGTKMATRRISRIEQLLDVACVTYPVYEATSVGRDLGMDDSQAFDYYLENGDDDEEEDSLRAINPLVAARAAQFHFPNGMLHAEVRSAFNLRAAQIELKTTSPTQMNRRRLLEKILF